MPAKGKNGKGKLQKSNTKTRLMERFSEALELPKEIVLNIPKITMIGSSDMVIENYKGIIEYENNSVKVNTGVGIIVIKGEQLEIREITSENIMIGGYITYLEILK